MRKQIDHFLLGLLWLLASGLGASFWFNTKFGFNIFYIPHWRYLGRLQASKTAIDPAFYVSMAIIAFLALGGLYLIARPRFRKVNFVPKRPDADKSDPAPRPHANSDAPTDTPAIGASVAPMRPPRLIQSIASAPRPAPTAPISAPPPAAIEAPGDFAEIREVFEQAGFVIKKPPQIGGLRPALMAIGSDETLWIGAVGTPPSRLAAAAEKMNGIFTETLEDIKITIRTFVIGPGDPADGVEIFDSIDALRDYMNDHGNRPLGENETEDFEAYSEYVDTVSDYFNKS
jgi:hypothetical protein